MKYFLIYTGLRIALFVACWVVLGVSARAIFGNGDAVWIWSLVIAAVLSSALSLKFLARHRERFAQSVQARAERATERFEERKTREDVD